MDDWEGLFVAARGRWPRFDVDPAVFRRAVLALPVDVRQKIDAERAAEFYLALGCEAKQTEAHRAFERHYVEPTIPRIRLLCGDKSLVDDVVQRLRLRFLVPPTDGSSRLLRYAARGRLAGLLHVSASRLALNARRDRRSHGSLPSSLLDAVDDPELAHLRASDIDLFKRCFESAIGSLTARQRTLLRLHLLDRLSIDEIGNIYGTHRSTAARWLGAARRAVSQATRQGLEAELGPSGESLPTLLALARSRLDLSLSRVLRSASHVEPQGTQVASTSRHSSASHGNPS